MRSKSPQTLSFQQPLPLSTSGDFYVNLSVMSSTRTLNFPCDFTVLTKMGNKNNPEQLAIVFRAKNWFVSWNNYSCELCVAPSKVQMRPVKQTCFQSLLVCSLKRVRLKDLRNKGRGRCQEGQMREKVASRIWSGLSLMQSSKSLISLNFNLL